MFLILKNIKQYSMKKITLLAVFFVAFTINTKVTIWEDSFVDYQDFDITILGAYQLDLYESPTYGTQDFDFENEEYDGTAIVPNSSAITKADPNSIIMGYSSSYIFKIYNY